MKRSRKEAGLEARTRDITPSDAQELLAAVKERLGRGVFDEMVGALRHYNAGGYSMEELVAAVQPMLQPHADLLAAFREFVPRVTRGTLGPQQLQAERAAQQIATPARR